MESLDREPSDVPQQDSAVLEWAESAGLENLRRHSSNADDLNSQSHTTLVLLLAAAGASTAYALEKFDESGVTWLVCFVSAITIWLFLLCAVLVWKCLKISSFPSVTNEPENLAQPGYSLDSLRAVEIENIQARIEEAAQRNHITARWLNYIRMSATLSPVVAAVVSLVVGWVLCLF